MRTAQDSIGSGLNLWYEAKQFLEHSVAISPDALHVLVGALAFLLACLILKQPASSGRPWLLVLALLILNEVVDLWVERWPSQGMQYGEGFKDVLLTMAVPTLLLFTARKLPRVFGTRAPVASLGSGPEPQ